MVDDLEAAVGAVVEDVHVHTAGGWDVRVTNPDGGTGALPAGFVVTETATDPQEPNDSIGQASGPLTQGVATSSYACREGDVDFFKISVPSGYAKLAATLTNIPYGCDFDLSLFNSAGRQIGHSGNGGNTNELIELASPAAGQYYIEVIAYTGFSKDNPYRVSFALTPPPAIATVSPAGGVPGTAVTINGSGFGAIKDGSYVTFGGVQCANNLYLSWNPGKIVVRVPSGVGGRVPVTVVTGVGRSGSPNFWVNPKIDRLGATRGKVGSYIAISGQGFGNWGGAATIVYFGKVKAVAYKSWSNYTITVKVPGGIKGTVAVKVVTTGGTSGTKNFAVAP